MFFDHFFHHGDEEQSKEEAARIKKEEAEITRNYREDTKLEPPEVPQRSKRYNDAPQRWETDIRDLQRNDRLDDEDHYVNRGRELNKRRDALGRKSRRLFLGSSYELEDAA